MTLRTSISLAEETRMLDGSGKWMFKVEIKRRSDTEWFNLSESYGGDWVLEIDADIPTPDVTVTQFTIRLLRSDGGISLAPGIAASALNRVQTVSFSPLAHPGRQVRVWAYCAAPGEARTAAVWHLWQQGFVRNASWVEDVVLECVSLDDKIQRSHIKEKEKRGSAAPGTPMPVEFQGLLDRWLGAGNVTLLTEDDPEYGVGFYETEPGSLGDFLLSQARRPAWDLRYRWSDAENDFRYTLYLPPRDKTAPDITLSPDLVFDVPGLSVSDEHVRNSFTHTWRDAVSRKVVKITDRNDASIADYDEVWMGIVEDEDSPINDEVKSRALLAYAKNDLGQPPTEKRVRIPFLPFLTLHHMIRTEADGAMFDYAQDYSVVGGTHHVGEDDLYSLPNLRGGTPVGMYYAWKRRANGNTSVHDWLIELVEPVGALETATHFTYRFVGGDDVYEVWGAYQIVTGTPTNEQWAAVAAVAEAGVVVSVLPTGTIQVAKPSPLETGLLYLSPKILSGNGVVSPPVQDPAQKVAVAGPQVLGPSLDVKATGGTTSYTITWTGDGVELSVNGAAYTAPPASPITVTRPAIGSAPLVYTFRATRNAISASDSVFIQPLGVALVPVDLSVVQVAASTTNAQAAFTATAVRDDTNASVPVKVTLRGCSGTNNGVSLPADTEQTVNGTIIAIRPVFGQPAGVAEFVAEVVGMVVEKASRGVQPVQQDTVGPSLTVTPGTPTATTLPVSWTSSAGTTISIQYTTGMAVVFNSGNATSASGTLTITRPTGTAAGILTFYAFRDGINNSNTVPVPPLGADTVAPVIEIASPGGDDNYYVHFQATASNPRSGAALPVVATFNLTATVGGVTFTSGNVLPTGQTLRLARPAFGLPSGAVTFSATVPSVDDIVGVTGRQTRDVTPTQQDTSWPLYEIDRKEVGGTGTAWLKLTERGQAVSSVQARTQVGEIIFGTFAAPTRGPGATSVVKGGTLGALQYEQDVILDPQRMSQVDFRANIAGQPTPMSIPTLSFDRHLYPQLVEVTVSGQTLRIGADTDTKSVRAYRTDTAGWDVWVDGMFAVLVVPVTAGATWPIKVLAYGAGKADVTGSTPKDEREVIVSATGAPAEPFWDLATLTAPTVGSDVVTLTLDASSAPAGYTKRVWAKVGGDDFVDITSSVGGSTLPTSSTAYTWATGWTRSSPPGLPLTIKFRAEILNGSSVVVGSSDNLPTRPETTYTV